MWEETMFFFAVFGLIVFVVMAMLSVLVAGVAIRDAIEQHHEERTRKQKTALLKEAEAVAASAWGNE